MINVDELAQVIREVDGDHSLGAVALAEAIISRLPHIAARQPGELIAQKVGDYRVTVAENTITVSHGRDIVFAYSEGDAEPIMARQPGAQVPVTTAPQPGKRVSILESACGPARKFDPVAADAELASVPLVPLWELPELHPRKVAAECLTTMERARQSTKPHTANRVRLTNAIALLARFVEDLERSERLGTAPPAQGIDVDDVLAMMGAGATLQELADWLIDQRDAAPGVE